MGMIRKSPAVVTIGGVQPETKSQRTARHALAAGAPAGDVRQPRITDYARTGVAELASPSSGKRSQ